MRGMRFWGYNSSMIRRVVIVNPTGSFYTPREKTQLYPSKSMLSPLLR